MSHYKAIENNNIKMVELQVKKFDKNKNSDEWNSFLLTIEDHVFLAANVVTSGFV